MRRASQRHSLVTLNEINITPLLDLAFVLLIIFIITRPLIEQNIKLDLPAGGSASEKIEEKDIARVEVTTDGRFFLQGIEGSLERIEQVLVQLYQNNPNLVVHIAGDKNSYWDYGVQVIDVCKRNNITRFNIRTSEPKPNQ
jgi:biopolymer transport protein ExbD